MDEEIIDGGKEVIEGKEEKKGKKVKSFEPQEPKKLTPYLYGRFGLPELQALHLSLENAYTVQINTWEIDGMTKERCDYLQGFYERLVNLRIALQIKEEEIKGNVEPIQEEGQPI